MIVKIGLYLMGKKGFECLKAVLNLCENNSNFKIAFVVCSKDKAVVEDYFKDIETFSKSKKILFRDRVTNDCNLEADVFFAISWRWMIKNDINNLIVFHDSILPKLRGFNPLVTSLIEGYNEIGVTAILANKEFDKGNIVGVNKLTIKYPIKINEAIHLVSDLYADLILEILEKKHASTLEEQIQNDLEATYSLWRDETDYEIDWNLSSDKIVRTIHALGFPYQGASTKLNNRKIRILEACLVDDVVIINRTAGKILLIDNNKPVVVCKIGLLKIDSAIFDDDKTVVIFKTLRTRIS